ncbi:MAG TPA: glycine--tRNA ligase subunit beta [Aestuariivirgaceae bacterium]|nr:glycine--tRNA ligase subunit beta [Aestuariivirgaceae bacterium]
MPELLLELFSEEIPTRMQARAAADLKALVTNGLVDAGLTYEGAQSHAGPRRLVLSVEGLAGVTAETTEERKGPRVDAPAQAIEGFLRSAGVGREDCAEVEDRKGRFLVARITKPGRETPDIVADLVPDVIRKFPWPKSMRWGTGTLRWVRPLHSIVCTFDGETVPFTIDGIVSGNETRGHRFMAPATFTVRRFEDYAARLREAFVMVDASERAETIRAEAANLAFAQGFEVVEDEALIAETAGLAEWPVVLMGSFDAGFLDLPPEVIATSLRSHQKCFSLRRRAGPSFETRPAGAPQDEVRRGAPHPEEAQSAVSKDGAPALANRYLLVANLIAKDGGKHIVAGNDRVIAARLADARFFWDQDRKTKLEDLLPKLEGITFHGKLGNQRERVERLESLAGEIAAAIGADVEKAKLAARLCKTDLVTGMVGEFPELQGLMGYYYALAEGHDPAVAEAIRDHYKPQGPSDTVPVSPVSQAVALADKLELLWNFWSIDERPTGSRDPFALRRAALGVIRILLAGEFKIRLRHFVENQLGEEEYLEHADRIFNLMLFIEERLQVHLREQGARHDLLEAVTSEYSLVDEGNVVSVVARVEALGRFLETEDGEHLLAGVKRAINIVRIEEKRDAASYDAPPDRQLLVQGEERALATAIDRAEAQAKIAVEAEDFEAAMRAIAKLREPIDHFFDHVTVNAEDRSFRENRLKLLNRIRAATLTVADFSRIEG